MIIIGAIFGYVIGHWIGGESVRGESGRKGPVYNPATGEQSGDVAFASVEEVDRAVAAALDDAQRDGRKGAVVLLSPACASFDQYPNFEVRGDAFVKAVAALPGVHMTIDGGSHAART